MPRPTRGAGLRPREALLALFAAFVLAMAMFWPLPLHVGEDIPKDLGDPLLQAWQVAWDGHALGHQPLDFFQSNTFWPLENSLAFSDALVGYTPAGLIGTGWKGAVARYDLLFVFAYALAFAGAYMLAREAGLGRPASAIAGAAFAYAPWKLEQNGHLHVISSGGVPLSLFLLLRGYRRASPAFIVAGFAVAAWQVSLGFTLGLQLAYLLMLIGLIAGFWIWRARPPLPMRVIGATLGGGLLLLAVVAVLAQPYRAVLRDYPESHRTLHEVAYYSPPVRGYLAASPDNLVWGKATAGVRKHLRSVPEQTIFPGATIALLALLGAVLGPWPLRVRVGLAAAVLAAGVFALGLSVLDGRLTYRLLYHYAPGWNGVRTPGRMTTLTSLGLALLAGGGAQWVLHRVGRAGKGGLVPGVAAVALGAAILVEGSGLGLGQPRVPAPPQGQLGLPSPQLHLPIETRRQYAYMLWSTEGFPRIVNGTSGFKPRFLTRLEHQVRGFPDGPSVRRLRALGVSTVILHPGDASRSPWHDWRRRRVRGLGISRRERGGVVLYDLGRR